MINIGTILLSAPLMTGAVENVNAHDLIMAVREDSASRMSLRADSKSPVTVDVSGFLQFRYLYNDGGSDEATRGFDVDRARIQLSGKAYDFDYVVSGQWSDTEFDLKDAFLSGDFSGFNVKVGQFVTSFYSGYVSDPTELIDGEYSVTALTYGQGRSQGVEISREFDAFTAFFSYNDGFNTDNSSFGDNDYGFSARLEYDAFENFTIGGAYATQHGAIEKYDTYTVDASTKFGAFDFSAAYVAANWNDSWNNYSVVGTASYALDDQIQVFGQYEYGVLEGAASDLQLGTVGVNYIFNSNVRWTNSFGYAFNGVDSGYNLTDTGWETSADSGQYLIRSMIQITF
tara:strand:- start:56 stop:1084 length:1029 start_codon:yes stop_codon:yes gene_type:complete